MWSYVGGAIFSLLPLESHPLLIIFTPLILSRLFLHFHCHPLQLCVTFHSLIFSPPFTFAWLFFIFILSYKRGTARIMMIRVGGWSLELDILPKDHGDLWVNINPVTALVVSLLVWNVTRIYICVNEMIRDKNEHPIFGVKVMKMLCAIEICVPFSIDSFKVPFPHFLYFT